MSLQQLARNDCRNHVEVVYASGETYKMRNVASVLYSQQDGKVSIQKITTSGGVEAKGVVKSQIEMETVELDVGVLAGLVVSHCSNEAMNRYTMNTFLTFVSRGELFGGVMPKREIPFLVDLVENYGSAYTENLVAAQKDAEKFVSDVDDWNPESEGDVGCSYGSDNT